MALQRCGWNRSCCSDHIGNGPDPTVSQRRPHRHQGGLDQHLQIPAFQFVTALDFEDRFAVKKVCLHDFADIWRQTLDEGGCEIGGG